MDEVAAIVRAIRAGSLAVLPTDTVYGLVCTAFERQAAVDLYRLKGRDEIQPTALVASTVDVLLDLLPQLSEREIAVARALLPGPFTLIVSNPERRFSWLSAGRPEAIGVRVPALTGAAAEVVAGLGAIVATSANLPGGSDPRTLGEVPAAIRAGVSAVLDGGELPGTPSTVIDVTGEEPVVLRSGAAAPDDALVRIAAVHTEFLRSRDGSLTEGA